MKLKTLLAVLLLALAAGCGGGGDDSSGNNPARASDAFVAGVRAVAVTEADDREPDDVSAIVEAANDESEALVL